MRVRKGMEHRAVSQTMVEDHWEELTGREVRYDNHTWALTGDVDVRGTGELLEVEARQVDDVRHQTADLRFVLQNPPDSLNPGDLVGHFDSIVRDRDGYHLVIKKEQRTYRYELRGLEYE